MPAIELANIERYSAAINANKVQGKILDPLPKVQRQEGPNCGFYALSIVMHYWKDRGNVDSALPARKRDVPAAGGQQPLSLRALGKQAGALDLAGAPKASTGGVFTAAQLAAVAKAANYEVKVISRRDPQQFIAMIGTLLAIDVPPIVAFDVQDGDPVMAQGARSHWGVIVGHVNAGATQWLIATHGHGKYYKWTASSLQQSNFGLCGTTRKLPDEVKVRLGLRGAATQDASLAQLTRWHWANAKALKSYKDLAAKPDSKVEKVELKSPEIRPGSEVAQDLGCHIVSVYPKNA